MFSAFSSPFDQTQNPFSSSEGRTNPPFSSSEGRTNLMFSPFNVVWVAAPVFYFFPHLQQKMLRGVCETQERSRVSASLHNSSSSSSSSSYLKDLNSSSSSVAQCCLKDLVRVLHEVRAPAVVSKRLNDANELVELISLPTKRVDEVYPGIYLGDYTIAENKGSLKNLSVSHVLNCAQGHGNHSVPTDESFYKGTGIKYFGIPAIDHPGYDLAQHFNDAAEFINACLVMGGRIYVHCVQGISRSSTIVCAYLMLRKSYSAVQALSSVRRKRNVCPNEGFLQQLVELNNRLVFKRDRLHAPSTSVSRGVSHSSSFAGSSSSSSSSSARKNPYLTHLDASTLSSSASASNGVAGRHLSSSSSTNGVAGRHLPSSSTNGVAGRHLSSSRPSMPSSTLHLHPHLNGTSSSSSSLMSMIPMKSYGAAASNGVLGGASAFSGGALNGGSSYNNYRRYAI